MKDDSILPRLLSLIENTLPHNSTELQLISLTKDNEKNLLISLTQICNQILRWIEEQSHCSNNSKDRSIDLQYGEKEILNKIVANLILFLNTGSQYISHVVGNIFLATSKLLLAYGRNWDKFIHSLCVCFEFTICNILRDVPQSLMLEADERNSIISNLLLVLNKPTWKGLAGNLQILRGIAKHLKDKDDAELVEVLLNSLSSCLKQVPWDLLNGIGGGSSSEDGGSSGTSEAKILFLGNLAQLLCTAVALVGFADGAGPSCESSIVLDAYELVPRLLNWCPHKEWSHILSYFWHKILMLMIKLSFHMQHGCSNLIMWLQLLQEYYHDLLMSPISQRKGASNVALEGSPFLLSLDDSDVCYLSSQHIQRKAIYLFLRCSLSLINISKTVDFICTCARLNSYSESKLNTVRVCFAEKNGLLKFYGWLQGLPEYTLCPGKEIVLDECINFASSFIRFFMQEDDILFDVLLQLFNIPSWGENLFSKQGRACHTIEEDILFHISNLFNPLLLFHVFLAELQYDHQLLLDYLISKDLGDKCVEYLLRCLRVVCNSWKLFVEYCVREKSYQTNSQNRCKRRRASQDESSCEWTDAPSQSELALSFAPQHEDCKFESNFLSSRGLQFEGVKECLLSLKITLRNLHKRKLFPYNPEVLIKRITKFEELSDQLVQIEVEEKHLN